MLGMDDLGELVYGTCFPSVPFLQERIQSFRLQRLVRYNNFTSHKNILHPTKEWEALLHEAAQHAQRFHWGQCLTVEKTPVSICEEEKGFFQQHFSLKNLPNYLKQVQEKITGKEKKEQIKKQQDQLIASYLLLQFWQSWDKETIERAYYVYKDTMTRQLLVHFIQQEQQKSWIRTSCSYETSMMAGSVVSQELSKISTWLQDW